MNLADIFKWIIKQDEDKRHKAQTDVQALLSMQSNLIFNQKDPQSIEGRGKNSECLLISTEDLSEPIYSGTSLMMIIGLLRDVPNAVKILYKNETENIKTLKRIFPNSVLQAKGNIPNFIIAPTAFTVIDHETLKVTGKNDFYYNTEFFDHRKDDEATLISSIERHKKIFERQWGSRPTMPERKPAL